MSDKSTIQGKAFEYAVCAALKARLQTIKKAVLADSSSMQIAKDRFSNGIDLELQRQMMLSADAGVKGIIPMEPFLSSSTASVIHIDLQTDIKGIEGDVRDVIITAPDEQWETGISVKHNHDAVKHPRISPTIDFGKDWYGIPVSEKYWKGIKPIFSELSGLKLRSVKWSDLDSKVDDVYRPLLEYFMTEIAELPENSIEPFIKGIFNYLLGSHNHDYYKLVENTKSKSTRITPYNFHGTLHQGQQLDRANHKSKIIPLPTKVLGINLKPDSDNTVLLSFDQGWEFSFRLHNASTIVEPSLKFDIQLSEHPSTLVSQIFRWS
jgi:hypothetical protein